MKQTKPTQILLTTILGTIICFCIFYWWSDYSFGKALGNAVIINFIIGLVNYVAVKRFNKDNKR
ncbi:MAG: hypothetical protein KGV44_13565 [Flavobacteriaceae bacterium]|nr:hypothetical protein [Flavobacteriaceae bacterium]